MKTIVKGSRMSEYNSKKQKQDGVVLVLVMIFLAVFSCLAVSMATISEINLQVANNNCKADYARYSAESGIEVLRYWLSQIKFSGTTDPNDYFNTVYTYLSTDCNLPVTPVLTYDPALSYGTISLSLIGLDSENQQQFTASLSMVDSNTISLSVTGQYQSISRTVQTDYDFGIQANSVFNYGVASRGPLALSGNIDLSGFNVAVESDVYIESMDDILSLEITGNSSIAGNVEIANPIGTVDLQGGQASIGGETGQDAIDNHVEFGVDQAEFPEPVPSYFEPWVTNVMDANVDTSSDATYENIRIPAGLNPTFNSSVTLLGVIYIETPNVVTFGGSVDITGIIVSDGDWTDNSGTNQLVLSGNVTSNSVSTLPSDPQFDGLQDETGTFIMAPGFKVSLGGNFGTVSGTIAANGVDFYGNAGGTMDGSVVNYSGEPMTLSGNSDLVFNRSGIDETPAGFVPQIVLIYDPASYSEAL